MGYSANSQGYNTTAVGNSATAYGAHSSALGEGSSSSGTYSTAVGYHATTSSPSWWYSSDSYATAVGSNSSASGQYATAVGYSAYTPSSNATAVGHGANASAENATAVGYYLTASGTNSTAVGYNATANSYESTAVGHAYAPSSYATAVGYQANASSEYATAVGHAYAPSSNSTAVGEQASAQGYNATSAGYHAYAYNSNSTAFGANSAASNSNNTAIGYYSYAGGDGNSVAVGYSASANASNAVAIGGARGSYNSQDTSYNTSASASYSVAIGSNAKASATNAVAIGSNQNTSYNPSASSYNSVAIGSNAKAANNGAIAIGSSDSYYDSISATGQNSLAFGYSAKATDTNAIGIGSYANAYSQNAVRIGASNSTSYNAVNTNSVGIGYNTNAWGTNAVRIGSDDGNYNSNGAGDNSVSIGYNTKAGSSGNPNATAIGMNTNASGMNSTGVGFQNMAGGVNTTAVGFSNNSSGSGATAVGFANGATGDYSSALGFVNHADVNYGVAVGFDSHAEGEYEENNGAYKQAIPTTENGHSYTKYVDVDQDSHALLTDATGNVVRTTSGSVVMQNQDGTAYYARDAEGNYYAVTKYGVNTYSQGAKLDEAPTDLDTVTEGSMVKVNDNLALGNHNYSTNTNASAMGYSNRAFGLQSSAIGFGNTASGKHSSAIGYESKALGENSFASGFASTAAIDESVALGGLAYADRVAATSVVAEDGTGINGDQYIGYDVTGKSHADDMTGVWRSTKAAVSIGDVNNKGGYGVVTRQITDVAAGSADTDAVNVAQLKALQSKFEDTDTRNKIHDYSVRSPGIDTDTNYNNEGAIAMNAMAAGVNASATGLSSIAIGEATANGDQSIAIGKGAVSTGYKAVVIGANTAVGQSNMAFGEGNHAGVEGDINGAYSLLYNGKDEDGKTVKKSALTDLGMHEAYLDADGKTSSATETVNGKTNSYLILKTQDGTKAVLKDGKVYNVTDDNKVGEVMADKDYNYLVTHSTASDGAVFESPDSKQGGKYATAFGLNNVASGDASLAFGGNAIRIGGPTGNKATGVNAVAFGNSTLAGGQDSVAFGDRAKALTDEDVAFGQDTLASGGRATAFGQNTVASGQIDTAFGNWARATAAHGSTAYGNGTLAAGDYSTASGSATQAMGLYANAWGDNNVAGAVADANGAFTAKDGAKVDMDGYEAYTDADGNTLKVRGSDRDYVVLKGTDGNLYYRKYKNGEIYKVAVENGQVVDKGLIKNATEESVGLTKHDVPVNNDVVGATAWGHNSVASGNYSTAFGVGSMAQADNSLAALGGTAEGVNSTAIGVDATAKLDGSIALGDGAVANTAAGEVGFDLLNEDHSKDTTGVWVSTKNALSVGDADNKITRQITGVAAGTKDTDAVNVAQLKRMAATAGTKHTLVTVNPTKTEAPKDANGYTDKYDTAGGNLNIRAKTTDGQTSFNIKLNDQIGLGQKGEPGTPGQDGKDGVDGKVTVTQKDGTTIIIGKDGEDGAPGLTIKGPKGDDGTDGKDAVAINGKDGLGTIGLAGKDGKDGIDGTSKSITTIRTEYVHEPGVDGKNGADGKPGETRIIYKDPDGKDHTVSTLDDGMKYGANIADATDWSNPVYNKLNSTVFVKGGAESSAKYQELVKDKTKAEDKYNAVKDQYSGENILTTVSKDDKGDTTISVLLDKDLHENTVTAGKDGKDGVDGKVTVVEKDGSTVVIGKDGKDGKNGISIKGADGKDGISISGPTGEPGKDGNDGHIGIAGKDGKDAVGINGTDGIGTIGLAGKDGTKGADGKDGIGITTIRTEYVTRPGVDGEDGEDGVTRIIYKDPEGGEHDVATLDDGLKFTGNNSTTINHNKLDTTVHVVGEGTDSDLTKFKSVGGNIAVEANGKADDESTLTIKLNKDVNLGGDGSLTVGGDGNVTRHNEDGSTTVVKNDPVVIKNYNEGELKDNKGNDVEKGDYITGLDNRTWNIDNPTYVSGRAATEDELKQAGDQLNTKITNVENKITNITDADKGGGFGLADDTGKKVSQDLGTNIQVIGDGDRIYKDDGKGGKVIDKVENSNITTEVVDLPDGSKAVQVALSDNVNLGGKGKDGKDGVDGSIGINGKDGKSGVGIDGKDGISMTGEAGKNGISIKGDDGKDGKDGISIKGPSGENGDNGHIGISGKDGKDAVALDGKDGVGHIGLKGEPGKDGKDATADITVHQGPVGVDGTDGKDGKDGMDRITYVDHNEVTHEVATLDDGLKFGANAASTNYTDNPVYNKLNSTVDIVGEGTKDESAYSGKNIKTFVKQDDGNTTITVKLDKDLQEDTINVGGKDGEPGKDGKDGSKGVDGSTVDRVVINDKEVAMLDDGMKYSGDTGNQLKMKLNSNVNIKGGATEYSENNNIAVVSDGTDTLTLRLAKNVNLGDDGTIKAGTAEMGKQTVTNTKGTTETGNYVMGLDNKTWDKDNIVSGRAATEDQLKAATESITNADKGGGFGLKDDSGTEVKKNLGESIGVVGGTTAGTTAKNIVTTANTKDGSIEVALAKDIDLGENGSIKVGDTTINKDGITSNKVTTGNTTMDNSGLTIKSADGDTKKDVSITNSGLNNGGNKITNVAAGEADTDAVNVSQLKAVEAKAEAHSTVSVGGKSAETNGTSVTGGNLTLTRTQDEKTKAYNYDVKLADNLSIGAKDGTDGKDGADGKIGVNGKDGSSVVINGKDGSIGLNGKDGKNGITIKGEAGSAGLDGKDGVTRMVYETKDGETTVKHEVATLDDGMKYSGDTGDQLKMKLNSNVNIKGGATSYTDKNNIAVVADGKDTLNLRLAKDITGINSITTNTVNATTINAGNTVINNNGVTINGGTSITNEGLTIKNGPTITNNNVDMNNQQIHNVKAGTNATDAVNVGQLAASNNSLTHSINKLGTRVDRVGANAAALAALHPLDFDPDEKLDFAAGMGNYNGANAAALGVFYRPNEDTMFSLGGSVGGGENMVNVGVSFKLGQHNHVTTSKVAMAKELLEMKQKMEKLEAQNKYLMDRLGAAPAPKELKNVNFPDVPTDHWAYQYVKSLADRGYLVGYPDGEFKGDRAMTRYEYAAVIYRALQNGAPVDDKMADILDEFEPELEHIQKAARFRVDRISGEDNDRHKVERVRVNDEDDKEHKVYKDLYGGKIKKEVKSEK